MNIEMDYELIAIITVQLRGHASEAVNKRWLDARCKAEQAELDAAGPDLGPTALLRQRQAGVE